MDLKEMMQKEVFAVVGNTLRAESVAQDIKNGLIEKGYKTYAVGKELESLNDIDEEIDIIDLCINPAKGINLLKEYDKKVKGVVIQPGAGSEEIKKYLTENNIPFVEDCMLKGIAKFAK